MSTSTNDFVSIQRRVLILYERGHLLAQDELDRAIDSLTGHALQMVRRRRQESLPPLRPSTPPLPPPVPQARPYTGGLRLPEPNRAPPNRRNPLEKFKTISKAALEAPCLEACVICMETHKKIDSVTTECGHEYGKACFNGWMNSVNSNKNCPTCRKDCPRVTLYKARASRKQPLIIED